MNKQILELAEHANADVGQLFAEMLCNDSDVDEKLAEAWNSQPTEVRQRIFRVIEQNQTKFAKLLIDACCSIVMGDKEISWADSIRISNNIKEEFGVE